MEGSGAEMLKKGPLNVFACYAAWGILPLFWRCLGELPPLCVLGYRILFSLAFAAACLTVMGRWDAAAAALRDRRERRCLTLAGLVIAVNWGSFIWAVNSAHVLDSSLAYYMYPILSILTGAIFFRERLTAPQWVAVGLMAAGIAAVSVRCGQVPWLALLIGGSFVLYGVVKRSVTCGAEVSLFAESLVTAPLALACVAWFEHADAGAAGRLQGAQWLLLPAAGIVTALPLLFFARGIRETPHVLSGLLMFVNPTLQLLIGVFLLDEPFTAAHAILFAFIWGGLALFSAESYTAAIKRRRRGNDTDAGSGPARCDQ